MWVGEMLGSVEKVAPRDRLEPRVGPGAFSVHFLALQKAAHCPAPGMVLALALM